MTDARQRLTDARVATLGTITTDGHPHLVPCCFVVRDDTVYSAVDGKPKSTMALRRLANITANPHASLLVDEFSEDWSRLWWVRVDGRATVIDDGEEHGEVIDLLTAKYPQYETQRPEGAVVKLTIERWRSWSAASTPSSTSVPAEEERTP